MAWSTELNKTGGWKRRRHFAGHGLTYTILREGGDQRIRNRVLREVLENEVKMSTAAASAAHRDPDATYQIVGDSTGRTLRLAPRRKETTLIDGTAQVDARGRLPNFEGRLAKSLLFWVRSVTVRRTYQAVGDDVLACASRVGGRREAGRLVRILDVD